MSTDGLSEMLGRIDERTAHIQEDVKELKGTVIELKTTVGKHGEKLATIEERIKNGNHTVLSRKQKASATGVIVAFIAAIIAAVTEYFRR